MLYSTIQSRQQNSFTISTQRISTALTKTLYKKPDVIHGKPVTRFSFIATSLYIQNYCKNNKLGEPVKAKFLEVVNYLRGQEGG